MPKRVSTTPCCTLSVEVLEDRTVPTTITDTTLRSGHTDIWDIEATGVAPFVEMGVHAEENDMEFDAADVLLVVPHSALTTRPAGASFDPIGVGAGELVYVLPATETEAEAKDLLLLGIAANEGDAGPSFVVDLWDPDGAGPMPQAHWLKVNLTGITKPAGSEFSVYSLDGFGVPTFAMSTFDAGADAVFVQERGHNDFNFAFTRFGAYQLTFQVETMIGGQMRLSAMTTCDITVDPPNTPPEVTVANSTVTTPFNTPVAISGVSVNDVDVPAGDQFLVDLAAASGVLSVGNTAGLASIQGNGTANVALRGTQANLNAALAALMYTPNAGFSGGDVIRITADDKLTAEGEIVLVTVGLPSGNPNTAISFAGALPSGVRLILVDVNGDGVRDAITFTGGRGVRPHVKVFDGLTGGLLHQLRPFPGAFRGRIRVEAVDSDANGTIDRLLITALGNIKPKQRRFNAASGVPA